jgi:hypothetical protein
MSDPKDVIAAANAAQDWSEDEHVSVASLQAQLNQIEEHLGKLYRRRAPLLERLAELRGVPELPAPRYRTETQQRLARCPRCTHELDLS